jgi:hypothetical protein
MEIKDAAIKCRYCQSDLQGSTQAPQPKARVGETAVAFSHSGQRFILGYGQDFFGIWDRERPGAPIWHAPRTNTGWDAAWNQFSAWEPRMVEVPRTASPTGPGLRPAGRYIPLRNPAAIIGILLALSMLGALIALVGWILVLAGTIIPWRDNASAAEAVNILWAVVIGIVWIIWQYRARSNLLPLGAKKTRLGPGWTIAGWLIPVANLVMPCLTMHDTARGSTEVAQKAAGPARRLGGLVAIWWSAWIGRLVVFVIAISLDGDGNISLGRLRWEAVAWIAQDLLILVSGVAAIALVRAVSEAQAGAHSAQDAIARSDQLQFSGATVIR